KWGLACQHAELGQDRQEKDAQKRTKMSKK
ncbi:unnamed protein product, partial [marine sediment metagenome]